MMTVIMVAADMVQTKDFLQAFGTTLAILLSIPALMVLHKISMFAGAIKTSSENTAAAIRELKEVFEAHEVKFIETERKVAIMWDGRERRSGMERRHS